MKFGTDSYLCFWDEIIITVVKFEFVKYFMAKLF